MARWLRQHGHNAASVYDEERGVDDDRLLERAVAEDRIVVTNDKDFSEMVLRESKPHRGIILLRLEDEKAPNKIRVLEQLIARQRDHFLAISS